MNTAAQIVEMDEERDRKTCLMLDHKVAGANRELAQWLIDHPMYSHRAIAKWLGCDHTRIHYLRKWASNGFEGSPFDLKNKPDPRARHDVYDRKHPPLESLDNSESDDDPDEDDESGIASPDVLIDNIMHAIGGINENARIFNKFLKVSALDREAATRIIAAIDKMIGARPRQGCASLMVETGHLP